MTLFGLYARKERKWERNNKIHEMPKSKKAKRWIKTLWQKIILEEPPQIYILPEDQQN